MTKEQAGARANAGILRYAQNDKRHEAGAWGDRRLGLSQGGVDFFVVVGGF